MSLRCILRKSRYSSNLGKIRVRVSDEKVITGMEETNDPGKHQRGADPPRPVTAEKALKKPSTEYFREQLAAAQHGSNTALGNVLDSFRNYLLLIANRELGGSIQAKIGASDLVQETFLQAQEIFDRFGGQSRQELAAWLAQILEFKLAGARARYVRTAMRDVSREQCLPAATGYAGRDLRLPAKGIPEQELEQFEDAARLRAALDRLPADYRVAIESRSLQGLSFVELGKLLNRSSDAARMTWGRAVLQLRKELRAPRLTKPDIPSHDERRLFDT